MIDDTGKISIQIKIGMAIFALTAIMFSYQYYTSYKLRTSYGIQNWQTSNQQLFYWISLYNAVRIKPILENYPLEFKHCLFILRGNI